MADFSMVVDVAVVYSASSTVIYDPGAGNIYALKPNRMNFPGAIGWDALSGGSLALNYNWGAVKGNDPGGLPWFFTTGTNKRMEISSYGASGTFLFHFAKVPWGDWNPSYVTGNFAASATWTFTPPAGKACINWCFYNAGQAYNCQLRAYNGSTAVDVAQVNQYGAYAVANGAIITGASIQVYNYDSTYALVYHFTYLALTDATYTIRSASGMTSVAAGATMDLRPGTTERWKLGLTAKQTGTWSWVKFADSSIVAGPATGTFLTNAYGARFTAGGAATWVWWQGLKVI